MHKEGVCVHGGERGGLCTRCVCAWVREPAAKSRDLGEGKASAKQFLTKSALTFAGLELSDATG